MAAPTTPSSKTPTAKAPEAPPTAEVTQRPVLEKVAHANLAAALAGFQAEIPTVRKSSTAVIEGRSSYTYTYADLSDVTEAAMPLLGRHGLSFTSRPTMSPEGFVLVYELLHEGGERIEGVYPLPSPTGRAQDVGSAITYARRYALTAVTGIAPGGDDDDAASAPPAREGAQQQQSRPAPTGWEKDVDGAKDLVELQKVYDRANAEGWAAGNSALIDRLNARKAALQAEAGQATPSKPSATGDPSDDGGAATQPQSAPASSEAKPSGATTPPPSDAALRAATETVRPPAAPDPADDRPIATS